MFIIVPLVVVGFVMTWLGAGVLAFIIQGAYYKKTEDDELNWYTGASESLQAGYFVLVFNTYLCVRYLILIVIKNQIDKFGEKLEQFVNLKK